MNFKRKLGLCKNVVRCQLSADNNYENKILMCLSPWTWKSTRKPPTINISPQYTNSNWIFVGVVAPSIAVKHTQNYTQPTTF